MPTPTPVAAKITPIKLQHVTKTGGDENNNQQRRLSDYGQQMYPLLSGIHSDELNPFDLEIQELVCTLLFEIMHLQDVSQEGLKVKDFGGHKVEFVQVPHLSSDKSFNNNKSWVDEAL